MTPDTIVFDIETQNFFSDPGVGRDNFDALKVSVVGVYSYATDSYACFEEGEIEKAAALFRDAETLVGFCSNRFDTPVLHRYFQRLAEPLKVNLWEKQRVDLLERIEAVRGHRISLDLLAQANLGTGKSRASAEAVALFRAGRMDELKKYCLDDVRLTKELYDLYQNQRHLLVPDRATGELVKVEFTLPVKKAKPVLESATAKLF